MMLESGSFESLGPDRVLSSIKGESISMLIFSEQVLPPFPSLVLVGLYTPSTHHPFFALSQVLLCLATTSLQTPLHENISI